MLLDNQWITEEIKEKSKKYSERNGNEITITPNLWDVGKAVQTSHLKQIEKEEQQTMLVEGKKA